ncbi:MAG: YdiU family protein [Albidovulum sp.]|nr:YdiU family protein [Albidovulum sp.]MDE0308178.1 YdiU family protein [Albidovulum sp.]
MPPVDSIAQKVFEFENTYAELPAEFYTKQPPRSVKSPRLIKFNDELATELGLDPSKLSNADKASIFGGNRVPASSIPLAMVYAGHQFGGWVPRLGDGRALLLGELANRSGKLMDVQLKGSGPTPYSRMGDGRAWVGPVLREYAVSEAMNALGVPTTRALAAVETGEPVYRETVLPGAILTRVSSSHVRVGTFQYFASRRDVRSLELLAKHVQTRLYPETRRDANPELALLNLVVAAQARLVADWMGIGFIHGVMNTDNMSIAGETIDYGPCAFMDGYNSRKVFSSIDVQGRYAYCNQPTIAAWNLAQFASSILPLISSNHEESVRLATDAVNCFQNEFNDSWTEVLRAKIGLARQREEDARLAFEFLALLEGEEVDYTHAFRFLCDAGNQFREGDMIRDLFSKKDDIDSWMSKWRARLKFELVDESRRQSTMKRINPSCIPRNHQIEKAIKAALSGNYSVFERLVSELANPFKDRSADDAFFAAPRPNECVERTFCGT